MEISIMSDLHFDNRRETGGLIDNRPQIYSFVDSVSNNCDVLVIAGDLCNVRTRDEFLFNIEPFCLTFPQVVFVPGNHEHWHTDCESVKEKLKFAEGHFDNLHVLYNDSCVINGQRFLGGTGWYDLSASGTTLWKRFADSWAIGNVSEKWIQGQHDAFKKLLKDELQEGDIVVSHHAPHERSILNRFIGHWANQFYVNPMPSFVWDRNPRLWVHGHLHSSIYYCVQHTEVLCNPKGHAHDEPVGFNPNLRIFV